MDMEVFASPNTKRDIAAFLNLRDLRHTWAVLHVMRNEVACRPIEFLADEVFQQVAQLAHDIVQARIDAPYCGAQLRPNGVTERLLTTGEFGEPSQFAAWARFPTILMAMKASENATNREPGCSVFAVTAQYLEQFQ
ncbi:hypothetical protein [Uliginosibacterium gangwonense]|uniref:hypothetical protein n=1 Tax=Uliginosibacterium gangwonense TaxID=392736 RepID=UPI0003718155|nr:hypothetical protein [Uliginosibacterium gangwonense]